MEEIETGPGNWVRKTGGVDAYLVTNRLGPHEIIVKRQLNISNPLEWIILGREFNEIADLKIGNTLVNKMSECTFVIDEIGELSADATERKIISLDNYDEWDILIHLCINQ